MSIYSSSVRKPVTTIMIYLAVIVFGFYSLSHLPIDLYPEVEFPAITVITTYQGANAKDIETNITKPIEQTLYSVDNLKEITSKSIDNISVVILEFEWETNLDEAANDIRNSLSWVDNILPDDAESPVLFKFNSAMMPIQFFAITANESYTGLEKLVDERIINPLNRIEGIGSVGLGGIPHREIVIEVDPMKLEAYNFTLEQIGQIIQGENMNMPAGNIRMGQNDYALRVEGEFKESNEIKHIVVGNQNGQAIYLRDIARVKDTLKEMSLREIVNGKRAVQMYVMKQSGANTVEIAKKVNKELERLKENLPPDIEILSIFDTSEFINHSIKHLSRTLMWALFFVVMIVLFFLGRWRATFIVVLTIPIALIVSFVYLFVTGNSINIISLSSLAIAIGMVVDDAIVVLENIAKHIDRGSSPREAAIYATNEVWLAVIITTLTVVAVFFPLTLIKGMTGALFRQLGWIVTITVVTSTITAITLTPMLSSKLLRLKKWKEKSGNLTYSNTILRFLDGLDNFYSKTLKWALRRKALVLISAFIIFISSLVLIFSGVIGTEFFPATDESQIYTLIELQTGTRVEETCKVADKIAAIVKKKYPEVEMISTSTGTDDEEGFLAIFSETGTHVSNIQLALCPISDRERDVWAIAEDLRQEIAQIPEVINYSVSTQGGMGGLGGNDVSVDIYGYDIQETTNLANTLKEKFESIQGARNIQITRKTEKPELQVILDQEKMSQHMINTASVSMAIRNRIKGFTCTRFREAGDEYNVIIRFTEEYRNSINDVENITIMSPMGQMIKLKEIGKIQEYWSPPNIDHKRKERIVSVTVSPYQTSVGELAQSIKNEIATMDIPPEYLVEVGGAYETQMESFADLGLLMIISLLLVYIVMAAQFESFKMPLIIMFSIPFAFSGVFLALFITNTKLSIIAGLGAVMLIGIVVKNAIVLVDYINLMRDRGYSLHEAIIRSGRSRLRPVLMTALTTIFGLFPMTVIKGEGSEIWSPMGISVIGGLIFSTMITMVLIPVTYSWFAGKGERNKKKSIRKKYKFMNNILNQ
ncbi:MAG: efflux RND transporter permease subunit [Bacteroidales bacterium]|nr:efflux RND transporter permease subunit [Bacteroidales bacterium]